MSKRYFGKNFKENRCAIQYTENVNYIQLEETSPAFRVDGIAFSRGMYGVQPLAVRIVDDATEIVTMPVHMYKQVNELIDDDDFVTACKAGKLYLEPYGYDKELKGNGKTTAKRCIGYNFVAED